MSLKGSKLLWIDRITINWKHCLQPPLAFLSPSSDAAFPKFCAKNHFCVIYQTQKLLWALSAPANSSIWQQQNFCSLFSPIQREPSSVRHHRDYLESSRKAFLGNTSAVLSLPTHFKKRERRRYIAGLWKLSCQQRSVNLTRQKAAVSDAVKELEKANNGGRWKLFTLTTDPGERNGKTIFITRAQRPQKCYSKQRSDKGIYFYFVCFSPLPPAPPFTMIFILPAFLVFYGFSSSVILIEQCHLEMTKFVLFACLLYFRRSCKKL